MNIDFAYINEELLFIAFVKTVAHRDVFLIIVDPAILPKIKGSFFYLLQGGSHF
jgi:hypothetical protein